MQRGNHVETTDYKILNRRIGDSVRLLLGVERPGRSDVAEMQKEHLRKRIGEELWDRLDEMQRRRSEEKHELERIPDEEGPSPKETR